jgi:hypothetical protein
VIQRCTYKSTSRSRIIDKLNLLVQVVRHNIVPRFHRQHSCQYRVQFADFHLPTIVFHSLIVGKYHGLPKPSIIFAELVVQFSIQTMVQKNHLWLVWFTRMWTNQNIGIVRVCRYSTHTHTTINRPFGSGNSTNVTYRNAQSHVERSALQTILK